MCFRAVSYRRRPNKSQTFKVLIMKSRQHSAITQSTGQDMSAGIKNDIGKITTSHREVASGSGNRYHDDHSIIYLEWFIITVLLLPCRPLVRCRPLLLLFFLLRFRHILLRLLLPAFRHLLTLWVVHPFRHLLLLWVVYQQG